MQVYKGLTAKFQRTQDVTKQWATRAARLPLLSKKTEETRRMAFGICQLFCSYHYAQQKQWDKAQFHFTVAKGIIDSSADSELLQGAEGKTWLKEVEKMGRDLRNHGIKVGSYVSNSTGLQKWIGIVTKVEGKKLSVRMTWVGDHEFKKAESYPVVVGTEAKLLEKVALIPIFEGYR